MNNILELIGLSVSALGLIYLIITKIKDIKKDKNHRSYIDNMNA